MQLDTDSRATGGPVYWGLIMETFARPSLPGAGAAPGEEPGPTTC